MSVNGEKEVVKRRTHRCAIVITCPSCNYSGKTDVYDEIGRLHAVSILIFLSIFMGDTYQLRKDKIPYGFERNHYCGQCGCYIGSSGKITSIS